MRPTPPPRDPVSDSPCIRQCCLDDDDVCIGCGRTLPEILAWGKADADERQRILARSEPRRRARLSRFT